MSNHQGSYMLNEVLYALKECNAFEFLGKERTLEFLDKVRVIGDDYDCNHGEILDNIGEELMVCYQCWDYCDAMDGGICYTCLPQKEDKFTE